VVLHNCLQGTGEHDLLSVSQIQATPTTFNLSNESPSLQVRGVQIDLQLSDGLYQLPYQPVTNGDSRCYRLPRLELTNPGAFVPISTSKWTRRVHSGPQPVSFRDVIRIFMNTPVPTFHEALLDDALLLLLFFMILRLDPLIADNMMSHLRRTLRISPFASWVSRGIV
jgi:hypothetical protein